MVRITVFAVLLWSICLSATPNDPGQVGIQDGFDSLKIYQNFLTESKDIREVERIDKMLDVGLWDAAQKALFKKKSKRSTETDRLKGKYFFLTYHFNEAEAQVNSLLDKDPEYLPGLVLKTKLQIQAWRLKDAEETIKSGLDLEPENPEMIYLRGKIRLLQKKYEEAHQIAQQLISLNKRNSKAYLLEADAYFWSLELDEAELSLQKSLELNPFDADARFNYGYAIWRRGNVRLLKAMAKHWEIALNINPLHFKTHWHWGNGHTNLTYEDYANPSDPMVREKLAQADTLISQGKIDKAIELTYTIEKDHPESFLPAMTRGSAFFISHYPNKLESLDSAQLTFEKILDRKDHYGPAHNGLAAVIKQRMILYLHNYDSLEAVITQSTIDDKARFSQVFPDVNYYPDDRVSRIVSNSLFSSKAYFPFLIKLDKKFYIPPLHIDLATTMDNPYFREATTFDNRQWMDIRGVGAGAAGIEYAIRGAYLERNVVLHEYVHLFHIEVMTDKEKRRISELYYQAVENESTIDYYSANNPHEYLAQAYTAYFSPKKVHPLNHKAMNTRDELKRKDPGAFQYVESLVQKQEAYQKGDTSIMKSNWAQVYLQLAREQLKGDFEPQKIKLAEAYLDTAISWDVFYLPAYLEFANLKMKGNRMVEAKLWLNWARKVDPEYAPVYQAYALFSEAMYEKGFFSQKDALQKQTEFFAKAYELEKDHLIKAQYNQHFRELYTKHCLWVESIQLADEYARNAPTMSTYLRDQKDEAIAFSNWVKGTLGYYRGTATTLQDLILKKPQDFNLKGLYADVLAINGKYKKAIHILEGAQRLLMVAGNLNTDFMTKIAEYYLALDEIESAKNTISPFLEGEVEYQGNDFRLIRVLAGIGETEKTEDALRKLHYERVPLNLAEHNYTLGAIELKKQNYDSALVFYQQALSHNPYHIPSRMSMIKVLAQLDRKQESINLLQEAMKLDLPWTPNLAGRAYRYLKP